MTEHQADQLVDLMKLLKNRIRDQDPFTLVEMNDLLESLAAILNGGGACDPFVEPPLRRRLQFRLIRGDL